VIEYVTRPAAGKLISQQGNDEVGLIASDAPAYKPNAFAYN